MKKMLFICALAAFTGLAQAAEKITPDDAPIVVYKAEGEYGFLKEALQNAIIGQGLKVTSTLHISDMLARTAADLDIEANVYATAESLEFCSIMLSHQMSVAHPANMSTCPLTISIYQTQANPDHIYLSYRRPQLLGEADEVTAAVTDLLDGIVNDAISFF